MTNKQQRIVFLLMGINAAVFAVIFILVSLNQRLAADDFHYLVNVQELGVWNSMKFHYNHWNTRWASALVRAILLNSIALKYVAVTMNLISLILATFSIKSLLSSLIAGTKFPLKPKHQWIISLYLVTVVFYVSFGRDDTWFWLSSTPSYLWGTFAAILGTSVLFKQWNQGAKLILTGLLFLYVGGSSESVALATIIGLCYLGFITHRKKTTISIDRKALHLATIACLVSFGITLMGPGLEIRKEHLPHYPFTDKLLVGFWNYFKFNFKEIPILLPLVILFVSPFGFFGRKHLQFQLISIREIFWSNRRIWGYADLTIATIAFALAFVMGEMGPTRTWFPITLIMVTVAVFIAYQLGTWTYIKSNGKLIHLVVACQLLVLCYQGWQGYVQISQTKMYASAVDERMNYLSDLDPTDETIELKNLPSSGWLFSAEITSDTAHFTNDHLELFFENTYNLMVKDSVNLSEK